ncbi:hypothetical protein EYF80_037508 [Liparis tanakae]|uniref:Uncharacterized protein n=1 Tax=Liparis tanakae TaxID=230148 RepID=A0A4Z2GGC4_9TELE|nr:hypothetical protein EYF80_037508 [Liparis tanakae]
MGSGIVTTSEESTTLNIQQEGFGLIPDCSLKTAHKRGGGASASAPVCDAVRRSSCNLSAACRQMDGGVESPGESGRTDSIQQSIQQSIHRASNGASNGASTEHPTEHPQSIQQASNRASTKHPTEHPQSIQQSIHRASTEHPQSIQQSMDVP